MELKGKTLVIQGALAQLCTHWSPGKGSCECHVRAAQQLAKTFKKGLPSMKIQLFSIKQHYFLMCWLLKYCLLSTHFDDKLFFNFLFPITNATNIDLLLINLS